MLRRLAILRRLPATEHSAVVATAASSFSWRRRPQGPVREQQSCHSDNIYTVLSNPPLGGGGGGGYIVKQNRIRRWLGLLQICCLVNSFFRISYVTNADVFRPDNAFRLFHFLFATQIGAPPSAHRQVGEAIARPHERDAFRVARSYVDSGWSVDAATSKAKSAANKKSIRTATPEDVAPRLRSIMEEFQKRSDACEARNEPTFYRGVRFVFFLIVLSRGCRSRVRSVKFRSLQVVPRSPPPSSQYRCCYSGT